MPRPHPLNPIMGHIVSMSSPAQAYPANQPPSWARAQALTRRALQCRAVMKAAPTNCANRPVGLAIGAVMRLFWVQPSRLHSFLWSSRLACPAFCGAGVSPAQLFVVQASRLHSRWDGLSARACSRDGRTARKLDSAQTITHPLGPRPALSRCPKGPELRGSPWRRPTREGQRRRPDPKVL